ncbi:S8 family peptidase [Rubrobacter indicoceani]|uniref:S8 family peptidase n=1 Tax=Rubrobacter indicoceani TaxID=2051957 RepID=UPI0013C506D7|nr:S8 family peptidase [Rubrobacter indicoceani]
MYTTVQDTGWFSGKVLLVIALLGGLLLAGSLSLYVAGGASGQEEPADGGETAVDRDENGVEYVSGELLVTYASEVSEAPVGDLVSGVSGVVEETLPAVDTQLISIPEVTENPDAAEREETLEKARVELESDPAVVAADYNYLREPLAQPNDPFYSRQWHLPKIGAPAAWDSTRAPNNATDGPRLAVVDTGADLDHPDLADRIVASTNTTNPLQSADDVDGHGTHVAGIAAAATDNGVGVAGTCPECSLLIARVSDNTGAISASSLIQGINWSVSNGADVINISLGGKGTVTGEAEAVARATQAGVTVVAAAGNENTNERSYPAAYEGVLAVSATTQQDAKASFSNFGEWIDLAAPGTGVYSSTILGSYGTKSGTSMSSPVVAGVAGLLAGEGLGRTQIENRLASTAVDLGRSGKDPVFGHGRVNAAAALAPGSVSQGTTNTAPTISRQSPKPGSRTRGQNVTIAATVRDGETDLTKSNITLQVDGRNQNFNYATSTDRLTKKMKLKPGRHKVRVVARDAQGLSKTSQWSFVVPR